MSLKLISSFILLKNVATLEAIEWHMWLTSCVYRTCHPRQSYFCHLSWPCVLAFRVTTPQVSTLCFLRHPQRASTPGPGQFLFSQLGKFFAHIVPDLLLHVLPTSFRRNTSWPLCVDVSLQAPTLQYFPSQHVSWLPGPVCITVEALHGCGLLSSPVTLFLGNNQL